MSTKIDSVQFDFFQQLMKLGIDHGCAPAALDIMKVLRHGITHSMEMAVFGAWQMISAGELREARLVLEEVIQNGDSHCEAKALLATTLFFEEDSTWQSYAFAIEASESADPTTRSIIDKLKQAADTGLPVRTLHYLMFRTPRAELTAQAV